MREKEMENRASSLEAYVQIAPGTAKSLDFY